jgi:hypothetical protein
MAITYTWKVTSMKVRDSNDLSNVVVQTYWEKTGTDEQGHVGTFNGATPFDLATVDPNNFVPFDQLTQEIVLGWIQSVVVGSYEEHVNEQIEKQINNTKSPITEATLPWATSNT